MIYIILAIIISYLIGSIPTGYIIARLLKGIDIREHGSGNVGATNLMRTVGKVPGIIGLLLDASKGFVAVTFVAAFFYSPAMPVSWPLFKVILGTSAVCGHVWTIFLKFKGGKGVATTIGVFLGLSPFSMAIGLISWLICASISRYVSLSSILMAIVLPVAMFCFKEPAEYIALSALLAVFITYTHIPNIKRLLSGTEYKIGQSAKNKKI